jgi:energy-coupling factor transport system permease protein
MMMVIVLHFVPALSTESKKLMLAQKARGTQVAHRNFLRRLKALTLVLVPLLKSSFRQADELAMGMESRCYHGGDRSHLHELAFSKADGITLVVAIAILPLTLVVNELA